ncbi:hypothetical protein LCGC14_2744330 [marine sediment metagenome]|uniref:Uncharacterized protein n=1 Tax=marine sediment metagenome TaxID=412755 RepID=A0A0F8Z3I6_9ZZZZ
MPHLDNPGKSEPAIFTEIPIKDLPKDTQARHKKRIKEITKLGKRISNLNAEGVKDVKTMIKGLTSGK